MADIDINLFGNHDLHPDEEETVALPPVTPGGGPTWEPEHEQETSFGGGRTQEVMSTDSYMDSLYKELSKHYC